MAFFDSVESLPSTDNYFSDTDSISDVDSITEAEDRITSRYCSRRFKVWQRGKEKEQIKGYADWLREERELSGEDYGKLRSFMRSVYKKEVALIAIDFEAWEKDTELVTEIGISIYDPMKQKGALIPFIQSSHIIIKENEKRKNGKYVPNHTANFNGGRSLVMSLAEAAKGINDIIASNNLPNKSHGAGVCLVGHGMSQDLKWLKDMGVDVGCAGIIDTQEVLSYTHDKKVSSLKKALRLVRQPCAFLHNAGNDAYYTMLLCLCLADPFYRLTAEIDDRKTMKNFKAAGSEPKEHHNISKKVIGSVQRLKQYLKRQPL
ncbi:hypothetical protein FT663_03486 [Candidozyma haemuli var. vulneris]|uniref:Gfd2/YDR514C-like C-terminal domain-containing protein n=1 Tax=Candidozyma haemuli TaxID=45357 RepID=A0A2V1AZH2_9ASCO|nr:hypothetical protein CXQ85_003760 [[Candida] haemuloni]KAF3988551.1 hypothetical protein FT662_03356 [[Candida] haemuloni var. vulneris]KAF3989750.1 hypothetical protein FT663_03486 [[Candida] haemuloni var. vulneris]PVH23470.1 hypothetical protein CXQ85_003760 [[Candida] haemuloni]